jgi:hypothetical protein
MLLKIEMTSSGDVMKPFTESHHRNILRVPVLNPQLVLKCRKSATLVFGELADTMWARERVLKTT